jgi:hypothetical protein
VTKHFVRRCGHYFSHPNDAQPFHREDVTRATPLRRLSCQTLGVMKAERRPHYWPADALHLFGKADGPFYLQLANQNILGRLRSLRAGVQGYEKYLNEYPAMLCATLDLLYVFRRAACTLDEELLQDYLFSYGWREANWGAWLAALAPSKGYEAHLQNRRPTLPRGSAIVDLAIASCGGREAPHELGEHWALLREIRDLVTLLPRVSSPLRLAPTVEEEKALSAEMEAVRAAYKSGGEIQAREAMQQKHLSYYFRGHLEWAKAVEYHAA